MSHAKLGFLSSNVTVKEPLGYYKLVLHILCVT